MSTISTPTLTLTGGTINAANASLTGTLGVTGVATFTAAPVFSSGTASQTVELNGSKALTTVAITGTGNYVKSASPTLTGTIAGASMTLSGTLGVTGALALSAGLTMTSGTGPSGSAYYIAVASSELNINAPTGHAAAIFNVNNVETGRFASGGQLLIGTTVTSGTATGEIVLGNGKALHGVTSGGSATFPMIKMESSGSVVALAGNTSVDDAGYYTRHGALTALAAASGNSGICYIGIGAHAGEFIFHYGASRYKVVGTSF